MSTRSLLRANGWLMLAALLVAAPAFAGKDDDYKAAAAAAAAGKAEEAARLYCQVAQQDPGYKGGEAKMMCDLMKKEAQKEIQKNEDRFQEGVKAFNEGRFDDAKQKFQNVRTGPRVEEARQYVSSKIPAAIQAKEREAAGAAESAQNQKFDQGVQAYNRNDFNSARGAFQSVSGGKKGDADAYLNKMKQYDSAMAEGDRLAGAKNYKAAQGSYEEAARLKGDGPGDPRSKAGQMASLASAPSTTTTPPVTTATTTTAPPPPVATTTPPRAPVVAAVKESKKVDVTKLLEEAAAARAKGDLSTALSKYTAVLAQDEHNGVALGAREAIKAQMQAQPQDTAAPVQKASSEADIMLAKGIREYYQGMFERAETHINDYLDVNGSKTGLSHFYIGASKLTRYYLSGERDAGLKRDADAAFRLAKKSSGFKAPGESYMSPKILKAYNDVSQ